MITRLIPVVVEAFHGQQEVEVKMRVGGDILYDGFYIIEVDLVIVLYLDVATRDEGSAEIFFCEGGSEDDGFGILEGVAYISVEGWQREDVEERGVDERVAVLGDVLIAFMDEEGAYIIIDAGVLFYPGEFPFHDGAHDVGGKGEVEVGTAPAGIGLDAVDAAGIRVPFIIAQLVEDIKGDQQEAAQADGEAENVDAGEEFAPREVAPGGDEVVF